jgi:phosphoglucose isomerase-like protein
MFGYDSKGVFFMSPKIIFQEAADKKPVFSRISPDDFVNAMKKFKRSLPENEDERAGYILGILSKDDQIMVKELLNINPVPVKEIDKYNLHEGDLVLASMIRRILAQVFIETKGMAYTVDCASFRDAIDNAGLAARVQNFGYYMRESWRLKDEEITRLFKEKINVSKIKRIVMPGAMGGSAVGPGVVSMLLANLGFQSEIIVMPHYPDPTRPLRKDDLIVMYSYSGNTEEALLWMDSVEAAGCQILGFSTAGRLEEICSEKNFPHVTIPGQSFDLAQPREHLPVAIVLLLIMLGNSDLAWKEVNGSKVIFKHDEWRDKLIETSKKLTELSDMAYNVDLPLNESIAKQAALFLNWGTKDPGKISNILSTRDPVFWASSFYEAIARRVENQFGECVEHPASAKIMPEDLHNEQEAYVEQRMEFLWRPGEVCDVKMRSAEAVFMRFRGPLDGRLDKRANNVFDNFLEGTPRLTFNIQDYGTEYPMLGDLEALLFSDLTRAYSSILRGVTPHYVHSMTYNKHFMASVPGGPGSTGKY